MARLDKATTYAIYYLNNEGKTPEYISEHLKITLEQVVKCVEKAEINQTANKKMKNKSEPARAPKKNKLNIVDEKRGVTLMTKQASELGDSLKSRPTLNNDQIVFRPRK